MSEPLENEIEEELIRKQLKALWDKFGLYLIGTGYSFIFWRI